MSASQEEIYFSFWSWGLLKRCPQKYFLRVLQKKRLPKEKDDKGSAIQGGVPHLLAEDFFKLSPDQRDLQWFYDNFDDYYARWQENTYIDWARAGKFLLSKSERETVPAGYKDWNDFGKRAKRAETWECTKNMVNLIDKQGLTHMETETELPFKLVVDEGDPKNGIPAIKLGGRIDVVFKRPDGYYDVWDWKAVKSSSKLDNDQLLIYKMGLQALGRRVKKTGFIMIKLNRAVPVRLLPTQEAKLKANMRMALRTAHLSKWPSLYEHWSCDYCDVRNFCSVYKDKQQKTETIRDILAKKPGKVDF